jgi:TM2 domain-containing membrane protein YozV
MNIEEITLLKKLEPRNMLIFESLKKRKSTAFTLALLLGGFGAQWFYFGKKLYGVLSILFFWTFIPSIISLVTLFFIPSMINKYNSQIIEKLLVL